MSNKLNTVLLDNNEVTPGKIICIGRNYVDHIRELNNVVPDQMVVFAKPNSAISNKLHAVLGETLHYEAEMSFMVQNNKFSAVAMGMDLTKRGIQSVLKASALPWERAKGFDGSALFSPFVSIDHIDPSLKVELFIDDVLTQSGGIDLMMHKPESILPEISSFITLNDGDIVMTGTPKGVGEVVSGKHYRGNISLQNRDITSVEWIAI